MIDNVCAWLGVCTWKWPWLFLKGLFLSQSCNAIGSHCFGLFKKKEVPWTELAVAPIFLHFVFLFTIRIRNLWINWSKNEIFVVKGKSGSLVFVRSLFLSPWEGRGTQSLKEGIVMVEMQAFAPRRVKFGLVSALQTVALPKRPT